MRILIASLEISKFLLNAFEGFTEFILYKENEITIEVRSNNIDLPFNNIQLTETIQKVADEIIVFIKELIQKFQVYFFELNF